MHKIRAICFDLDNTLWDLDPVIPRAEGKLYAWYADHYPGVTKRFTPDDILAVRNRMIVELPDMRHDLSWLRMQALEYIAVEAGYAAEMAADAFQVFQSERNAVTLYSDVIPVLESMAVTHELFALSNGNADLEVIGIRHFFKYSFSARELGMAKPDPGVYAEVCRQSGLAPDEILHVGDNPENDIVAAANAGLRTVWINRNAADWEHDLRPDHVATNLHELCELFDRE